MENYKKYIYLKFHSANININIQDILFMILQYNTNHLIIPVLFEPPVRTLRATIPENESHIFR